MVMIINSKMDITNLMQNMEMTSTKIPENEGDNLELYIEKMRIKRHKSCNDLANRNLLTEVAALCDRFYREISFKQKDYPEYPFIYPMLLEADTELVQFSKEYQQAVGFIIGRMSIEQRGNAESEFISKMLEKAYYIFCLLQRIRVALGITKTKELLIDDDEMYDGDSY